MGCFQKCCGELEGLFAGKPRSYRFRVMREFRERRRSVGARLAREGGFTGAIRLKVCRIYAHTQI
ncbi:hypothetical protein D3C84_1266510 [compost metagenome]